MSLRQASIAFALWALAAPAFGQDVTNPDRPISINGAYNSSAPTCVDGHGCWFQTDVNGNLKIVAGAGTASIGVLGSPAANTYIGNVNTQGTKATYRAFTSGAIDAAGVILQLQGSASKTIRVTHAKITGTLTTGADGTIVITRYSTAASGGTSSAPTIVPLDSTDAAASAALLAYTAVPTAGSAVGGVDGQQTFWPAVTAAPVIADFTYGTRNTKPVLLQGTAQFLVLRTSGFASYTGATYAATIEWTEE